MTRYVTIKRKKDAELVVDLQDLILKKTNGKLISVEIHTLCRKFVSDLKKIPLSQELQKYYDGKAKK